MKLKYLFLLLLFPNTLYAQTAEELKLTVYTIASDPMGGRMTGSKGYDKAAEYLYNQYKEAGIRVKYQAVQTSRGPCKNIVAWIPGTEDKAILVGSHLDHLGRDNRGRVLNGADDNASGCAGTLGLAKRFRGSKFKHTLIFVHFTGEEIGFWGAKYYVKNPLIPIDKHVFMLNLDMIGRLKKYSYQLGPTVPEVLEKLYRKHPFAQSITFRENNNSDHVIFHNAGIPVVFLHTANSPYYHTYKDDPKTLNYEGMELVCNYAYDLIFAFTETEQDYIIFGTCEQNKTPHSIRRDAFRFNSAT